MIFDLLFTCIDWLIGLIFSVIPSIPVLEGGLLDKVNDFITLVVENGLTLFTFIIKPSTVAFAIPLMIAIIFGGEIYHIVMFILKKIPFLNIK